MTPSTILAEAILFDLDGTLIDSTQGVFNAWEEFGKKHPFIDGLQWRDVAHKTHGRRLAETLKQYCNIQDDELPQAIYEFEDIVINCGGGPDLLPGVPQLLSDVNRIIPDRWTIVTSASSRFASAALIRCNLPFPSKGLVTADDIASGQGKPKPAPYLAGARRISNQDAFATKCRPAFLSSLVIEDAPSGLAAGRRAGAITLAVCTNHTREFLETRVGDEKPDFIVDDLEQ
ncbi:HAD-like protein [Pisolithus thermaeus]|nr:HAD-like protein [Pisolithus croceorrhizus]KAI6159522.1 HAD-like protein [Pisolithus thermaeus]